MPEEYTKRQALLDCIEMWRELAKSGSARKPSAKFSCAFCHYDFTHYEGGESCKNCPALGYWGVGQARRCLEQDSIFARWLGNEYEVGNYDTSVNPSKLSRQYWARQIVKMAEQRLFELDGTFATVKNSRKVKP